MLTKRLRCVAVAVAMASTTAAYGVVFQSSFHPTFGSAFPLLSFSGLAQIDVPDACLMAGSGTLTTASGVCAPTGFIDGTVSVDLFATANTSITETLNFPQPPVLAPPPPLNPNPIQDVVVDDLHFVGGKLVGFDTWLFGDVLAPPLGTGGSVFPGGHVWIQFVSNFQLNPLVDVGFTVDPKAYIFVGDGCATTGFPPASTDTCKTSNPADVVITVASAETVPEPGALALLSIALGALGLLRFRRNSAPGH